MLSLVTSLSTDEKKEIMEEIKGHDMVTVYYNELDGYYPSHDELAIGQLGRKGHRVHCKLWADDIDVKELFKAEFLELEALCEEYEKDRTSFYDDQRIVELIDLLNGFKIKLPNMVKVLD